MPHFKDREIYRGILNGLQIGVSVLDLFFQEEDGIRGTSVTGVQTCALPICYARSTGFANVRSLPTADELPPQKQLNSISFDRLSSCWAPFEYSWMVTHTKMIARCREASMGFSGTALRVRENWGWDWSLA